MYIISKKRQSMDCDKIKERNRKILEKLIEKYNIKETYEDLIAYYTTVYIHKDFKQKRVRLLGIKKQMVEANDGTKIESNKKKTVQLYVLSKRMIQTLPEDTVYEISYELAEFVFYFEELKLIKEIELAESTANFVIGMNALADIELDRMKE